MNYCAITADIDKSRDIPERNVLQRKLLDILKKANNAFKDHIVADFSITLGDEWQGVLKDISQSYKVVSFFREGLHPISVSFGIGEGEIETDILPKTVEMDGQVFRRSRQALQYAKEKSQHIFFVTNNALNDLLLNTTLQLLQILRESWTERQYKKIMLYKQFQKEMLVAKKLNVSQADINKALTAANGRAYLEAEQKLNQYLTQLSLSAKELCSQNKGQNSYNTRI
ncbi:MAG: SatD family protein [bacterium]